MPRGVRKRGNRWEIYNTETGQHYGWSDSRAKAWASVGHAEGKKPKKKYRMRRKRK